MSRGHSYNHPSGLAINLYCPMAAHDSSPYFKYVSSPQTALKSIYVNLTREGRV